MLGWNGETTACSPWLVACGCGSCLVVRHLAVGADPCVRPVVRCAWCVVRGGDNRMARSTIPSFRLSTGRGGFETLPYVPTLAAIEPRLFFRHGPRISAGVSGLVRGIGEKQHVACSLWHVACSLWIVVRGRRTPEAHGLQQTTLPPLGGGLGWGFEKRLVACG